MDAVEPVSEAAITDRAVQQAGSESRAALLAELAIYPDGQLYRISVRLAGPDPRAALRENAELSDADMERLERKLAAMGARAKDGPWAAGDSAAHRRQAGCARGAIGQSLGMETSLFKPRVRQLKELGLTESLEIGYRLSPRGEAFLRRSRVGTTQ